MYLLFFFFAYDRLGYTCDTFKKIIFINDVVCILRLSVICSLLGYEY